MEEEFPETCTFCGRGIDLNENYFSINFMEEKLVTENEVNVIDAENLAVLCYNCGSKVKMTKDIIIKAADIRKISKDYIEMFQKLYSKAKTKVKR